MDKLILKETELNIISSALPRKMFKQVKEGNLEEQLKVLTSIKDNKQDLIDKYENTGVDMICAIICVILFLLGHLSGITTVVLVISNLYNTGAKGNKKKKFLENYDFFIELHNRAAALLI